MKKIIFATVLIMSFSGTVLADDPIRPNPILTPGAWHNPSTPLAILCQSGYTAKPGVRHVTDKMKEDVFHEYGLNSDAMSKETRATYEIDHLVPLVLDGLNDIKNLWPQSYKIALGAHQKDQLEVKLHKLVCSGQLPLNIAQAAIAEDWIAAYNKYVGTSEPAVGPEE